MPAVNRADLDFMLFDWLGAERLTALPRFAGQSAEDYRAFLDLAERLAENEFLPTWKPSDSAEPALGADGEVRLHPGVRDAVRAYLDAGLQLATVDEAHGGMQLPITVGTAAMACIMAANIAASGFPMLSQANARVIAAYGTPRQIELFARPQHEGAALGTMCLSEPEAGSSLGDITTRARPAGADEAGRRFRLTGRKMWISGAGQDITPDTIHLVLAKIENDDGTLPAGTKGISLFLVPRLLPEIAPGGSGPNDLAIAGLNHKMGYRGISNCLLNLGEGTRHRPGGEAGALGWLVGEPGQGLAIMFQMMNEARINVGLGAAALAWRGYLLSRDYAFERRQGRPLEDRRAPAPVPLVRHPDVRRMLLAQKAIAEGALALCLYTARLADLAATAGTEEERSRAHARLDLLTPVTKSWPSEFGLEANHMAIQVHGGYGYTRDFDVEQLYRDNRLNPIHEGTTGIQGLDLLRRKIMGDGGAALAALLEEVRATADRAAAGPGAALAPGLRDAAGALEQAARSATGAADPVMPLAHATAFLHAAGHVVVAWLLTDMALVAGAPEGRLWAARHFHDTELPRVAAWLAPLGAGSRAALDAPDGAL
ncbi:acyl-CoA dehydrogenase [Rhodosalinus halophilus]|uniref:Acyl-CoA dehydrogenase n=1 Tax=Rhodosalinus halophilus TaxID=2259333 RepID=A0A365UC85_9RHOB|nr:acyl-CoA dehydrogenase [Rhodosalinus halophilus]RBI86648.1 acyl-CoA dehydrogenase [Rhodosalinus halophilus]